MAQKDDVGFVLRTTPTARRPRPCPGRPQAAAHHRRPPARSVPRRLRPPTAGPRVGPAGRHGRRRHPGPPQGQRNTSGAALRHRRHRPVPAAGRGRHRGGRRTGSRGAGFVFPGGLAATSARGRGRCRRRPSKALEYAAVFARHRIPYRTRSIVTEVLGRDRTSGVRTAKVDADGRIRPGTERVYDDVDVVGFGWGFTPQLELPLSLGAETRLDVDGSLVGVVDERQESSVPGLFLAGEVTGVGGAALAVLEGFAAGTAAAGKPGIADVAEPSPTAARQAARHRRFAERHAPRTPRARRLAGMAHSGDHRMPLRGGHRRRDRKSSGQPGRPGRPEPQILHPHGNGLVPGPRLRLRRSLPRGAGPELRPPPSPCPTPPNVPWQRPFPSASSPTSILPTTEPADPPPPERRPPMSAITHDLPRRPCRPPPTRSLRRSYSGPRGRGTARGPAPSRARHVARGRRRRA